MKLSGGRRFLKMLTAAASRRARSYTLEGILSEPRKPGRDPRDKFVAPQIREEVRTLEDVQAGMVLEGAVIIVAKFGALVDIGVHQDGLVHISELSNRFIKDPPEVVKTGQIVKVKVLTVDSKSNRIGLSMKALFAPASRPAPKKQIKAAAIAQAVGCTVRF